MVPVVHNQADECVILLLFPHAQEGIFAVTMEHHSNVFCFAALTLLLFAALISHCAFILPAEEIVPPADIMLCFQILEVMQQWSFLEIGKPRDRKTVFCVGFIPVADGLRESSGSPRPIGTCRLYPVHFHTAVYLCVAERVLDATQWSDGDFTGDKGT